MSRIKLFPSVFRLKKKDRLFDVLLICFISLAIIFVWFRWGMLIAHEESGFFFAHPERWVYESFFSWLGAEATGFGNPQVLPTIPFQSVMFILSSIGLSDVFRQAVAVFFLLMMSGISMYLLTSFLIVGETRRVASLVAGIFYMLSPYALYVWHRFHSAIFFVPFLPLVALLYLRGIEQRSNIWKNALYLDLALVLPLAAFVNPTYLMPYVLIVFTLFCFYVFKNLRSRSVCLHGIKFTVVTFLLGVLFYSWWLLPMVNNMYSSYQKSSLIQPLPTLIEVSSLYYPIISIIRSFESYTFSWLPFASNPLFVVLTFLLPIFAFGAVLFRNKNRNILYFSMLALFGLFLAAGSQRPFGSLFLTLFKLMPFSAGFRAPYDKLGIILAFSYSFLIGASISSIYKKLARRLKSKEVVAMLFSLCMVLIIIIPSAFPIFSGDVFKPEPGKENDPMKGTSYYVLVPNSYQKADEWLDGANDTFRIISFPVSPHDYLAYRWESGYAGINPWNLWGKPMIVSQTWESNVDSINERLGSFASQSDQLWKAMAILNAKYALVHNDFYYTPAWDPRRPEEYAVYLQNPEIPDYASAVSLMIQKVRVPDYVGARQLMMDVEHWRAAKVPEHIITLDNTTLLDDQPSLKITSCMTGDQNWEGGVEYEWNDTIDLSAYGFLSSWIKFDSLNYVFRVYFELTDAHGNYKKWEITDQTKSLWTRILIPLNASALWQSTGNLNLTSVKGIRITFDKTTGPMQATVWWINRLGAVPTKMVEQEAPLSLWKQVQVPEHKIALDNATSVDNESSVKIVSYMQKEESWEGGVEYEWTGVQNLSAYKFISFWIKYESLDYIARVYFRIADASGNYKKWEITNQITASWIRVAIPLKDPAEWQSSGNLDVSSLKSVRITVEKKWGQTKPTVWWIDNIQAVPAKVSEQKHVSKSETFGDLEFFRVEDGYFLPILYTTSQYTFTHDIKTMFNDLMTTSVDPRNTTMFLLNQLSENDVQFINKSSVNGQLPPRLTFQKIDPTRYVISIENANAPFFLVFSSTYDKDWAAFFGDLNWMQTFSTERVPDDYHFIANGYANAWYIDKTGTYTITLEFWPQKLFYIGSAISLTTFLVCITYLTYSYTRNKAILKRIQTTLKRNKPKTEPEKKQSNSNIRNERQ